MFNLSSDKNRRTNLISRLLSISAILFLPPANEVCEGYVFIYVCLSTGGSRSLSGGGYPLWGGFLSRGSLSWRPPHTETSRGYASYWNAFLFFLKKIHQTNRTTWSKIFVANSWSGHHIFDIFLVFIVTSLSITFGWYIYEHIYEISLCNLCLGYHLFDIFLVFIVT